MLQIKCYDDIFQAIRALTVKKIPKIRISSQKFLQNESFLLFSLKGFDLNCTPEKIQPYTSHTIIGTAKHSISKETVCLLSNSKT